ncbi:MAG: transposase [Candidatus Eremiobacteraeota bacterium]|nr:transposase [Candidatus Eremiobacteraeota bacterium]MCW5866609.1 transposase [Candidatus Eremiobacteraeota bacterium]
MLRHPKRNFYLVLDNGTTHCSEMTKDFFAKNPRIVPIFTPTHASWLNQIEIWFSVMSRQALRKVSFTSRQKLIERLEAYVSTPKTSRLSASPPGKGGAVETLLGSSERPPIVEITWLVATPQPSAPRIEGKLPLVVTSKIPKVANGLLNVFLISRLLANASKVGIYVDECATNAHVQHSCFLAFMAFRVGTNLPEGALSPERPVGRRHYSPVSCYGFVKNFGRIVESFQHGASFTKS